MRSVLFSSSYSLVCLFSESLSNYHVLLGSLSWPKLRVAIADASLISSLMKILNRLEQTERNERNHVRKAVALKGAGMEGGTRGGRL